MPRCDPSPIRVGYVLKMYPRFSETFILNEVLALQEHGAELEIFSLRSPIDGRFHENLARVTAPVTYLPVAGKTSQLWMTLSKACSVLPSAVTAHLPELLAADPNDAAQALELAVEVVTRDLDHLHAHFGSVATTVARLAAKLTGITYTFTAHAKDIFHEEVDHAEMRVKAREAAAVVTVSDYNERWLHHAYGEDVNVVRIYNGLDLEVYSRSPYVDRPPMVVGVGRLVEKKGFRHLVHAIAALRQDGVEVTLELVGTGPEESALRGQVADLGLTHLVVFHGPLPQAATREVVRRAAVLAAPCVVGADGNTDGLPTVVLEGLALGTPVVATPITGIPEAVIDQHTGLLVPSGDAHALAEALHRLLHDATYAARLAANGRRHIERSFDVRPNTHQLLDVFRAAISHRRASSGNENEVA